MNIGRFYLSVKSVIWYEIILFTRLCFYILKSLNCLLFGPLTFSRWNFRINVNLTQNQYLSIKWLLLSKLVKTCKGPLILLSFIFQTIKVQWTFLPFWKQFSQIVIILLDSLFYWHCSLFVVKLSFQETLIIDALLFWTSFFWK